jgi:hypothetical protein
MIGLLQAGASPIGTLLTAISILVSVTALLIAWTKDRTLRKKEYADRIRSAAGTVTARLERRKELFLHLFDTIQPL